MSLFGIPEARFDPELLRRSGRFRAALDVAVQTGSPAVEPSHLLVALARCPGGPASMLFARQSIPVDVFAEALAVRAGDTLGVGAPLPDGVEAAASTATRHVFAALRQDGTGDGSGEVRLSGDGSGGSESGDDGSGDGGLSGGPGDGPRDVFGPALTPTVDERVLLLHLLPRLEPAAAELLTGYGRVDLSRWVEQLRSRPPHPAEVFDPTGRIDFAAFTPGGRAVMTVLAAEAPLLGRTRPDRTLLLHALACAPGGLIERVFRFLSRDPAALRCDPEPGGRPGPSAVLSTVTLDPLLQQTLHGAAEVAARRGGEHISEHDLLTALLDAPDGLAAACFAASGADGEQVLRCAEAYYRENVPDPRGALIDGYGYGEEGGFGAGGSFGAGDGYVPDGPGLPDAHGFPGFPGFPEDDLADGLPDAFPRPYAGPYAGPHSGPYASPYASPGSGHHPGSLPAPFSAVPDFPETGPTPPEPAPHPAPVGSRLPEPATVPLPAAVPPDARGTVTPDPEQALALLRERLVGQDAVVERLTPYIESVVRGARRGFRFGERPRAALLFCGPPGTGKTMTAQLLAEAMFGTPDALTVFEMGQFASRESVNTLIGAPVGYIGCGEGLLTGALRENPHRVFLFDEIEKADERVLDALLRLLDEGRLGDPSGPVHDGRDAVVVLTCNLAPGELPVPGGPLSGHEPDVDGEGDLDGGGEDGEDGYAGDGGTGDGYGHGGNGSGEAGAEAATPGFRSADPFAGSLLHPGDTTDPGLRRALAACFRPELLSRLDEVVPFAPFGPTELQQLAENGLRHLAAQLDAQLGVTLQWGPAAARRIAELAWRDRPDEAARGVERCVAAVVPELLRLLDRLDEDGGDSEDGEDEESGGDEDRGGRPVRAVRLDCAAEGTDGGSGALTVEPVDAPARRRAA